MPESRVQSKKAQTARYSKEGKMGGKKTGKALDMGLRLGRWSGRSPHTEMVENLVGLS